MRKIKQNVTCSCRDITKQCIKQVHCKTAPALLNLIRLARAQTWAPSKLIGSLTPAPQSWFPPQQTHAYLQILK